MTRYGFVIDQDSCIGCHACTVACKTEHQVPLGVNRTWVKYVETGAWPDTTRTFSVMRCNHCSSAPCVTICPTQALFKRADGIVDFDTSRCIGCKSCMQACPYDALYIDPFEHTAQKCNYCVHRVEVGLEPACVVVCPEQAIVAGDLDDPSTRIARLVATEQVFVRSPEQGTDPKLWYKGGAQVNLDPVMAKTGSMIWRDPPSFLNVDLTPGEEREPRVVYNTDHPMPWGWRVSSYFLTKGIAAGLVLVAALFLLLGGDASGAWMRWGVPLVSGFFLVVTGGLLVWDLKRPDRFFYLLTKGNPSSWLVRGAWILGGFGAVLAAWFVVGSTGRPVALLVWPAAVLGLATAGYTAFLFGQAEARDLWQTPTLLWHMLAGAFAAGGGVSVLVASATGFGELGRVATLAMVGGTATLGLISTAELFSRHPTRNIAMAMHELTKGAYARQWWWGGQVLGVVIPVIGGGLALGGGSPWPAMIGGLGAAAGIWFADDAFVKAGQSVPLS